MLGDDRVVGTREVVKRGVLGVGIVSVKVEFSYGLVMLAVDVGVGSGSKVVDSVGVGEGVTNKVEDPGGVTLNDDVLCSEVGVDMCDIIGRGVDVVGIYNGMSVISEPLPTSL